MIQRIQSVWLLISAILSLLLIKGGIVYFTGDTSAKYYLSFSGLYKLNNSGSELLTGSFSLSALIILIPVLSFITIFLFKKRRIQKIFSLILVAFSLCLLILIFYYSYLMIKNEGTQLVLGIKMFFPLIILLTSFLGYRGISKDESLVKSYDRLR
jgi:hypothetical protein